MTFPGANSGKIYRALARGVRTPLWGSAVCPWSTEVCTAALIQTMEGESQATAGVTAGAEEKQTVWEMPNNPSVLQRLPWERRGWDCWSPWAVSFHLQTCLLARDGNWLLWLLPPAQVSRCSQDVSWGAVLLHEQVCHTRSCGHGATGPGRAALHCEHDGEAAAFAAEGPFPIWHLLK